MRLERILLVVYALVLIWSAISPKDYFTWALEVFPAIIALAVLWATRSRFEFTPLVYVLVTIHCCILMVGGHYTYAEVPLFDWLSEVMGWERNNYDKVGHFAQGFVPAMITREVLVRKKVVSGKAWLNVMIVALCLSISAMYEFLEWMVAELTGESAEAFLGTQGYAWDTQADMLFATVGAIVAIAALGKFHDKQLKAVTL
ncbi:MAG: DUF2238 domain-containing protein [Flavobacteriales bacterium]